MFARTFNVAETGTTVLVHGRDRERTRETAAALHGDGHDWYLADFADLDAVREFAAAVRDDHDRLDCLVNNAGTWQSDRHLVDLPGAEAGVELTFVVNHLAPFLLTHELAALLAETADRRADEMAVEPATDGGGHSDDADEEEESSDGTGDERDAEGSEDGGDGAATSDGAAVTADAVQPARVVTVSSGVHRRAEMDIEAVQGPDGPSGVDAYGLSKLANVMFTYEFARRGPDGVTATCCHPGTSPATRLDRDGSLFSGLGWRIFGLVGKVVDVTDSPTDAARTPAYLACSPAVTGVGGKYFEDCERTRSSEASYDREAQRELWDASERWTGLADAG